MRYFYLFSLFVILALPACKHDPPAGSPSEQGNSLAVQIDSTDGSKANPWKNAGCNLITDEEVQQIFGIDPKADVLNTRTLPGQAFCLRTWNKPDWKERESHNEKPDASYLEPHNRLIVQVFNYHTEETSVQQFDMLKRDRRVTYEEDVTGLGDAGLWSTANLTLLIKKGHLFLSVSVEYSDTPHDNLTMAKRVAELALLKM